MSGAAREWAALAARHPTPQDRCLACGAKDDHHRGPLTRGPVDVFAGVELVASRCRLCSTRDVATAGRGWLQFKNRKELRLAEVPA